MDIFEFKNYRDFIKKSFEQLPKKGHGQGRKLAKFLNVSSTFVSQVLQEQKSFSAEQAYGACEFFGLSELETSFFLLLLRYERAGTDKLRRHFEKEIAKLKASAQKISVRLDVKKILSDEEKAIFYSDWQYSAVRLLAGIKGYESIEPIAEHLRLSRKSAAEILQFLLTSGLLLHENGKLKVGPSRTHLEPDSPFIKLHHQNWRSKALEHIREPDPRKLHYSAPMTIGVKDVEMIRLRLLKCIEDVGKIVDPAPNELLMCLSMDWFPV